MAVVIANLLGDLGRTHIRRFQQFLRLADPQAGQVLGKGQAGLLGKDRGKMALAQVHFPGHILERDGIAASLVLAELIAKRGVGVPELFAELEELAGHFAYGQRDIKLDAGVVQSLRLLMPGLNPETIAGRRPADVSHKDGLRLGFDDGSWVLLRPSRTKPIVRIYAEGCTAAERDALLDAAVELAKSDLL